MQNSTVFSRPMRSRIDSCVQPLTLSSLITGIDVSFPSKLSKLETRGSLASNWKRFRRVWTNYEVVSRLVKQLKEERTVTLLTCLGPDALEIFDGLSFASEEERKVLMFSEN